jgi:acyl-ACP thioesterase
MVRTYECGANGKATLPTICNYLQEAASRHAELLGFSKSNFEASGENITWVLTRMFVRMERYPAWEEEITVETFPRGGRRIVAWRDFEIKDSAGRTIGRATSDWMVIDLATRKLVPVPEAVFAVAGIDSASVFDSDPYTPRLKFPVADQPSTPSSQRLNFRAQNSHIDLNGHVNNVRYIEWLLESCPGREVRDLEIVFRSETLVGDEVRVEQIAGDDGCYHRVFAPDGREHVIARTA